MTANLFVVLASRGSATFVKSYDFFVSQAGLVDSWGQDWILVEADSSEAARVCALQISGVDGLFCRVCGSERTVMHRCAPKMVESGNRTIVLGKIRDLQRMGYDFPETPLTCVHGYTFQDCHDCSPTTAQETRARQIIKLQEELETKARRIVELREELETYKSECASISAEFGLPPTMRPAEGEIARLVGDYKASLTDMERMRPIVKAALQWHSAATTEQLEVLEYLLRQALTAYMAATTNPQEVRK